MSVRALRFAYAFALVAGCVEQSPDVPSEDDIKAAKENILSAPPMTIKFPVKDLKTQGLTCAQADSVIALIASGKTPKAWKYFYNAFKAPVGLVPQEYKASGGRVIQYAAQGG